MSPRAATKTRAKQAKDEPKAPNGREFGAVQTEGPLAGLQLTERSPGHTAYARASDGSVMQIKTKRKVSPPKRERTVRRTDEQTIRMLLALPETYRCYNHATDEYQQRMDATLPCHRGRPRGYPDALYSAVQALTKYLGGTLESACATIANRPDLIELIWAGVEQHASYPLTPAQQASRDAGSFPDRTTALRTLNQRWTTEVHEAAVTVTAVPIAVEIGHFSSGDVDDPSMHVHADGTVLLSPSKARTPQAVDPTTGEIYNQRYDTARGAYHEGGGTPVQGTKFTILSVGSLDGIPSFPLGVTGVDGPAPPQEYQRTMALFGKVREELDTCDPDRQRRPISLVTDAAADRAQIAAMITNHNTLVTSPPRPTQARKSNDDGTTTPETPREHALTYLPQCARCHQQDPLVLVGSKLVRRTAVNAELHDTAVAFRFKRVSGSKRHHYYLQFDCRCGAERRITFAQLRDETDAQYTSRAALMRPWADVASERVYRTHRATNEGANSHRDRAYPFKRIPAYGRTAQTARLASDALGQALYALALSRQP